MNRKPKVLFLAPVSDFKGGAERSLFDLLSNPLVTPVLGVPGTGPLSEAAEARGIPVWTYDLGQIAAIKRPFRLLDGLRYMREILALARSIGRYARLNDIDFVHSNGLKAHALAVASRMTGGRPAIVHIRDIPYTKLERLVWVLIGRMADRTILISRPCWPSKTIPRSAAIVHNGFALRQPIPMVPHPGVRIGFIGRIHPAKGLHHLISALAEISRDRDDVSIVVRGRFAPETPQYEEEILRGIAEAGLGQAVRFDGFFDNPDDLYEGIDIVCVPSFVPEPLGRVVIEAMGYGLPVVAANTGGIPELLTDDGTGMLVDRPEDLAGKLRLLIDDSAKRRALGAAARAHCIQNLSMEALHANVHKVYQSLLK